MKHLKIDENNFKVERVYDKFVLKLNAQAVAFFDTKLNSTLIPPKEKKQLLKSIRDGNSLCA